MVSVTELYLNSNEIITDRGIKNMIDVEKLELYNNSKITD